MPMVIAPVAFAAIGAAVAGTAISTAIVGALISSVLSFVASAVFGPSKPSGGSFEPSLNDRTVMVRQPITERKLVYGRVRVSGPIVFLETTGDDKYLHMVVPVASHEVEAIEKVYFDDRLVWTLAGGYEQLPLADGGSTSWNSIAQISVHLGAANQTADAGLVAATPKWTAAHKLSGIAYLYVMLTYSADAANNPFASGIPNVSALVKGKKVYDPRSTTTAWSENASLCIRDYLMDAKYGVGASAAEIDDTTFSAAANICDESVTLKAGGTESRYTLNGMIDLAATPRQIIEKMLTACAGKLPYTGGKFRLYAGAYQAPTVAFGENDLRAPISVQTKRSRRDNYNAVKGVFSSIKDNYTLTEYPAVVSSAYAAQDGETIYKDLELPFTVSAAMAQRIAKIFLLQSRQQMVVSAPCKLSATRAKAGDAVPLTNERLGWSNKAFEVDSFSIAVDESGFPGVDLVLKETAPEVYDWTSDEEIDYLASEETTLPNPFTIAKPVLTLDDEVRNVNETAVSVLIADVISSNIYQTSYEVQARRVGDTEWVNMGRAGGNRFELLNVVDDAEYEVQARVFNSINVRSPYATATRQIVGKTAPPSDVEDFSINIVGTQAHLTWKAVTDADLSHYIIRHSPLTVGATFSNSIDIVPKVARPATSVSVPALPGTYFIKAVDVLGLLSLNAKEIVTTISEVAGLNVVATQTESPSFTGSKTGTVAIDNSLILDTDGLFDDEPGNFDDDSGELFDGGDGTVLASGTYETPYVDQGAIYTSRISVAAEVERVDYTEAYFDAEPGQFDEGEGLFDGEDDNYSDTNVSFLIATTNDNPAGTPAWSDWRPFVIGDYTCRAAKFMAVLTTTNNNATPRIKSLTFTLDMPDRVAQGQNVASGTSGSGLSVTFTPAFKATPAIGIAAQNMATGDYATITAKGPTGFNIIFRNSAGTVVDRTFDYLAKGYGELS